MTLTTTIEVIHQHLVLVMAILCTNLKLPISTCSGNKESPEFKMDHKTIVLPSWD